MEDSRHYELAGGVAIWISQSSSSEASYSMLAEFYEWPLKRGIALSCMATEKVIGTQQLIKRGGKQGIGPAYPSSILQPTEAHHIQPAMFVTKRLMPL